MTNRPTPFALVFDDLSRSRFPALKNSLAERSADPHDRDAFLLDPEGVQVLRSIVPDEGVGDAIDQHVSILHNAYLFWDDGERTVSLDRRSVEQMLTSPGGNSSNGATPTYYVQFPERVVWARVTEGQSHEPLDGLFVHSSGNGTVQMLGIFGLLPGRPGFSIVEASGQPEAALARDDGSPLFSPVMQGGDRAHLFSIAMGEELVELGARALVAAETAWPAQAGDSAWKP